MSAPTTAVLAEPKRTRAVAAAPRRKHGVRRRIGSRWYTPYLFILPHFIVFAAFIGWPFLLGFWISLHDWNFFNDVQPWVGLDNFAAVLDPDDFYGELFYRSLRNTVVFVVMSTPPLVLIGLGLASLLNGKYRGRTAFRAIFLSPWTLSVAVVGLLWWFLFNGTIGPIGLLIESVGFEPPPWLTANPWAWISITTATVWWTVGFNTIILLAGMQSISPQLYEAAAIDGAGRWQQFVRITVPLLRPVLLLVITLQIIAGFNLFGQPQLMTGGGPPTAQTTPVQLYVFQLINGTNPRLGIAAAVLILTSFVVGIISVVSFRLLRTERA
jgi:multiple sugar transport system permease protein